MAIYHLHSGFVSRSTGRSAVQSAAYISGEKLYEERRAKYADYSKKANEVVLSKTLVPENSKYRDISVWNTIENFEDNYAEKYFKKEEALENYKSSAQVAMIIVLALPNELSKKSNEELLDKFVNTRFTARGLITTYAIHQKEGNLHAHLLISRRAIGENGEFETRKDREICTKTAITETRKLWADLANEFLEREGIKERITEKSFADLGINLEATKHRGWYSNYIGTDSRIAQENIEIYKRNEEKILSDPNIVLDYLNEKKAVFTQKDILKEIEKRVISPEKISMVFERVLEEAKYVGEGINGEFLYTGDKYQKLESDVMTSFEKLTVKAVDIQCNEEDIAKILNKYDYLSDEQREAVSGLSGDDGFGILIGKAGAGKTTTMRAVAEVYKTCGSRVIGMSLSAIAAENLGKDANIESATIASWSHRWRVYESAQEKFLSFNSIVTDGLLKQLDWFKELKRFEGSQLKPGDAIIVDEAGMVGAKDWKNILDAAEKFGAKVIAVGDDNQFKPISAGDCFRQFKEKNVKQFELNEIRRQKEEWQREANIEFSKLNTGTALAIYENHGHVRELRDNREIAQKYVEIEAVGSAVVLCSTKKDCTEINAEIRELKRICGQLGEDLVKIENRSFAINDQVIFTENNKNYDIKNGQAGVVKSFENGFLSIETESGLKKIDIADYSKIDHGYAITLHKAQGKTYDNTIVLANKMLDAKAAYVAMTRHRENVDLYYRKSDFSSFKSLLNSVSRYTYKDSFSDYEITENQNRAHVIEYQELIIETASILKDIHNGTVNWSEYYDLKNRSISLGKEMLRDFDSHKLYLQQQGITKEKLEIQCGLRQRLLSNVEILARDRVNLYAQTSNEVRNMFNTMKAETFNIKNHENYPKYCEIRSLRNDLAKEILANYPLHRECVNQVSKEFFVSKKCMEQQVDYENSVQETINERNTFKELLQTIENIDKPQSNTYREYLGTSIDFVKARINDDSYKLVLEMSEKEYGYKQYVSQSMIKHYILENDLNIKGSDYMLKYANILIQDKIGQKQEVTTEMIVSSIKQVVCFEALKEASGELNYEIQTEQSVNDLETKAQVLSDVLSEKNVHVLNDKNFIMKALQDIPTSRDMPRQHAITSMNFNLSKEIQKSIEISPDKNRGLDLEM